MSIKMQIETLEKLIADGLDRHKDFTLIMECLSDKEDHSILRSLIRVGLSFEAIHQILVIELER